MNKNNAFFDLGCVTVAIGTLIKYRTQKNQIVKIKGEVEKYNRYYLAMVKWFANSERRPIKCYLTDKGYKKIAIYGAKEMGMLLKKELEGTEIVLDYFIDMNAEDMTYDVPVLYPQEDLPIVDAVIVTPFFYYKDIKKMIETKMTCPIVSLLAILDGLEG